MYTLKITPHADDGMDKTKDYYITGRANPISCAVGLR